MADKSLGKHNLPHFWQKCGQKVLENETQGNLEVFQQQNVTTVLRLGLEGNQSLLGFDKLKKKEPKNQKMGKDISRVQLNLMGSEAAQENFFFLFFFQVVSQGDEFRRWVG